MPLTVAVARAAANTSTGTQDITTTDLGGLTPVGVLFLMNYATSDATAADHGYFVAGAASGATERWACASSTEHGVGSVDTARRAATDVCLMIQGPGSSTLEGEADFDSFITNGVRINWTNAVDGAYFITAIFFAGTNVECHAGTFSPGTSVNSDVDVTAPGFEPDAIIFATHGNPFDDTHANGFDIGFGFAVNDGSDTQRSICYTEAHGSADGDPNAFLSTNYGIAALTSGTSLDWACEIGSFDASGFTATLRLASAGSDDVGYLAVYTDGSEVWAGTHDTPTSTGNQASTAPGIEPDLIVFGMTELEAVDTGASDATAGSIGVAALTASAQFATSFCSEDGVATTNTQSLSDDQAVNLPDDDGTSGIEGTLTSMDATGWTINFSAVTANAKKFIALAIGSGSTLPPLDEGQLVGGLQPLGGGFG